MWRNLFTLVKARYLKNERRSIRFRGSLASEGLEMSRVAVRNVPNEDRMQISFQYPAIEGPGLKKRVFNFDRLKTEELERTLVRITANVSKQANKKKKKKKEETTPDAASEDVAVKLTKREREVEGSVANTDAWEEGNSLFIADQCYSVQLNIPTVKSINLPDCLMAGICIYPKLLLEFADEEKCTFRWYRKINGSNSRTIRKNADSEISKETVSGNQANDNSDNEEECPGQIQKDKNWSQIHVGQSYTPSSEDIGHLLQVECIPSDGRRCGDNVAFVSKSEVSAGPGTCPFEKRHQYTKELTPPDSFRFVSYNILADCYADSDFSRDVLFPYCPPSVLRIDYRKQLLLKELLGYNADIICLQEVDKKVFEYDLKPVLSRSGFVGHVKLKTGEVAEGTATFFRASKFRLVERYDLEMQKALSEDPLYEDIVNRVSKSAALKEKLMERTSVLQVTLLQSTDDHDKHLIVATVHLYFHPRAPHIRTIQSAICIRHIERILDQLSKQNIRPSVIFCGDLNAYPEAGAHVFLTTKRILAKHADWYAGGKDEFVEDMNLSHGLDLVSACGYPRYTNYVGGFTGCLDYIYIDSRHLETRSLVPMPSHEDVTEYTALPNAVFPSDHIALVCNLGWKI